jgi:hypothetical protein
VADYMGPAEMQGFAYFWHEVSKVVESCVLAKALAYC